MTNPYLYIDGEEGRYNNLYFPGDSNGDGPTITDSGTRNILDIRTAAASDASDWQISGGDITSLGLVVPPAPAKTGTIADTVINSGVVGAEWTTTGTAEQITCNFAKARVFQGDSIEVGAWVYLEASSSVTLLIRWFGFAADNTPVQSNGGSSIPVTPNQWTYISGGANTVSAGTHYASLYIEANGNQSAGDKLYVGAAFLGVDASTWYYSSSPNRDLLDIRFTAKILSDGTILSNRTGDSGGSNGDAFHIEALNSGFLVQTGTVSSTNVLSTQQYTTAQNIYQNNIWYDFRWTYEPSTGTHNFYVRNNGWLLIDTGTVTATSDRLNTSYGLETLSTGITTTNSTHAIINSFGIFTDDVNGWVALGKNENSVSWTGDITGSELVVYSDGTTQNYNEAFYASKSGWIINADATDKGALSIPFRSELNFGAGDFTIVQSFAGVANHAGFTPTYDNYDNAGVKLRGASGNFGVLIGTEGTLNTTTNILDGQYRFLMVERESGVARNVYVDDPDTVDVSGGDSGSNIDSPEDLTFGTDAIAQTNSMLPMLLGVTITFDRLLTSGEKRDLYWWIKDGFFVEDEPSWLRQEAVLYLNPNDRVQEAEYLATGSIVNLAVEVPNEIYIRYDFTTLDGVSNPQLTNNEVRFSNLNIFEQNKTLSYERDPFVTHETGPGGAPFVVVNGGDSTFFTDIRLEELGSGWINDNWTINLWLKVAPDSTAYNILTQGGTGFWALRERSDNTISFYMNGVPVLVASGTAFDKYTMVTVRKSGSSVEMFMDASSVDTGTAQTVGTLTNDVQFFRPQPAIYGPLDIWTTDLSDSQIATIYNASPESDIQVSVGTATLTDSFSTVNRVWERI